MTRRGNLKTQPFFKLYQKNQSCKEHIQVFIDEDS